MKEENVSLARDFAKLQEKQRQLMSSESQLQTSKEQLAAQHRIDGDEQEKMKKLIEKAHGEFNVERTELNGKLQELLVYNEKQKDQYLKQVIVYREKYTDYKNKVK